MRNTRCGDIMPSQEAPTVLPPHVEAAPLVVLTGILPSYKNRLGKLSQWGLWGLECVRVRVCFKG